MNSPFLKSREPQRILFEDLIGDGVFGESAGRDARNRIKGKNFFCRQIDDGFIGLIVGPVIQYCKGFPTESIPGFVLQHLCFWRLILVDHMEAERCIDLSFPEQNLFDQLDLFYAEWIEGMLE